MGRDAEQGGGEGLLIGLAPLEVLEGDFGVDGGEDGDLDPDREALRHPAGAELAQLAQRRVHRLQQGQNVLKK